MVIVRTLQGLFLGVTFPTQMSIISQWAPSDERARMTMFSNSGLYFGTVVALQFSGIISRWMGWTSVFYIFGVIGLIWYAIWLKIIRESPEKDRRITAEEKQLILSSIGDRITRNIHIPWLQILTSVPVWALIVAHFTHCWLAYTLLAHMPRFFSQILNLQISEIGFVSSLPYLVNGCLSSFSGLLADKLLSKKVLTLVQTRKLFTCGSFLMQSILLFCITMFMGSWSNVVFLITTVCFSNLVMTGFWINFIDIAPQFSGILFAISNTIATVSGIISPTLTGILIQNENIEDWKKVFLISAAVCLFGSIFYGITASGVVQPWAKVQSQDETLDKINSRKNSSAITPDV
ncbi:vesicular glutamate transporter 2.2-like isoform X2 [Culicoides brevitarsis]